MGLLLAGVSSRFLLVVSPQHILQLAEVSLNLPVLSFTAVTTVLTGLLAGLAPVIDIGGLDIRLALKEGSSVAGSTTRGQSLRSGLLIAELALTLVLAFSCGLLIRSLMLAQTSYPGFNADRVLAVELQLPPSRYKADDDARRFYDRLMESLRREPGVESVGAVDCPPSTGGCAKGWYSIADMLTPGPADVPLTLLTRVDPDYMQTVRMKLLAGRGFTEADRDARAVVVNESLARRWWPERPQLAVGHRIKFGGPYMDGPTREIVGVVGDVSQSGLDVRSFSEIYVRGAQRGTVVMIRAMGDPSGLIPAVRREVASLDRNVPIVSLVPFRQRMQATLARRRFYTLLLGIFAALAVAPTLVGLYGILNYWVTTRQKEIAIRMALGAGRSQIVQWTGRHVVRIAALSITLGAAGCWGTSQFLRSMVFGISEQNPWMFLAASGALFALAILTASVPICRATRVDPICHLDHQ